MDQWNGLLQAIATHLGPYAARLLGAAAIALVAWLLAKMMEGAVRRLAESSQLERRLQTPGVTLLVANIAYWLVWLFALPALLGTLELVPRRSEFERLISPRRTAHALAS